MRTTDPDFLHYLKTSGMNLTGKYDIPTMKGIKLKHLDSADLIGFNYSTNVKKLDDEESFEYCFDGMPKGSCLCISSVGCMMNPGVRRLFNIGLKETLNRLEPSQLIIYGKLDDEVRSRIQGIPYKHIEGEMTQRINKYRAGG